MDSAFVSRHLVPQNVGNIICVCYFLNIVFVILVGYAQTAVVGIVLLTGSTVYTELSGRSWTSKFRL